MADNGPAPTPENQRRIYRCVELLPAFPHKHQLINAVREEFQVSRRQAERYLRSARTIAVEATKRGKDDLIADSLATYRAIIADPAARDVDKIRAQEAIDRLFGLNAPYKIAPTGPDGNSSWQAQTPEEIKNRLIERITQMTLPSRQ